MSLAKTAASGGTELLPEVLAFTSARAPGSTTSTTSTGNSCCSTSSAAADAVLQATTTAFASLASTNADRMRHQAHPAYRQCPTSPAKWP